MFFNNKFNIFFGLNLTLVYTFPMCMTWRFHFSLRNYDFNNIVLFITDVNMFILQTNIIVIGNDSHDSFRPGVNEITIAL